MNVPGAVYKMLSERGKIRRSKSARDVSIEIFPSRFSVGALFMCVTAVTYGYKCAKNYSREQMMLSNNEDDFSNCLFSSINFLHFILFQQA